MRDELISVIIPVHNGETYLGEAIESALAQTYRPLEIFVIDDGSTDGTASAAKRFEPEVRYVRQEKSGPGEARNQGVKLSQGEYLAFLDADDVWLKDKLSIQAEVFSREPEWDIVSGRVQNFYSPELDEGAKNNVYCSPFSMPGLIPSAMLVKKSAFLQAGYFGTHWKVVDFADWYLRSVEAGLRLKVLEDLVARRRLHKTNLGMQKELARSEYAQALKLSLDRRRKRA